MSDQELTSVVMSDDAMRSAIMSAFRITLSPHEWVWTQKEQEEMAQYILWLSRRHTSLEMRVRFLQKEIE